MAAESRNAKTSSEEALPSDAPYEEIVERLEKVVATLERGDLPLEESVVSFREGMELLRRAEEKLKASEKKVEELLENGKSVPLTPERSASEAARPVVARRPPPQSEDDIPF